MKHAKRGGCVEIPVQRQQVLLGRGNWDADALRDVVREHVVEHLTTEDGVLVIDKTGFLKKGQASCGVGRHYTGSVGKITNCQIGVFAASISARHYAFVDRVHKTGRRTASA